MNPVEMAESVLSFGAQQPREYPRGASPEERQLLDTYLDEVLPRMEVRDLGSVAAVDDGLLYDGHTFAIECTPYYFDPNHHYFPTARRDHLGSYIKRLKRHIRLITPWLQDAIRAPHYWCSDLYSRAFYHWIAETLPRIHLLTLLHPGGVAIALPGILSEVPYVRETLALFPEVKATFLSKSRVSRFEKLNWVSPMGKPYQFNPLLMRQVRKRFAMLLASENRPGWRRTYISRAKANRRVVTNEKDLEAVLARLGFQTHYMETLTLREQMTICSESEILIGLHGAGLANMLFLPRGSLVIEMRRDNGSPSCFFRMAHALSIDYKPFYGACNPSDMIKNEIFVDMSFCPEHLEEELKKALALLQVPVEP